ncbi:MAG: Rpn family recombination-promoting nuclease/putative transposase [Planctomycetaceae bacterium]|nr:Rpn family recombination-promoting nuclease/putative transposase [Planctomycetaceae bacterium]
MEQRETDKQIWRPTNPHDRFCRRTAFHPLYAPDFLKSCDDPVLTKYVDLDHLQEAPTTHLSDELKEVIMDASLATRLLDTNSMSEVILFLEHKSRPSRTVALQLLTEAVLSLSYHWLLSNRSESGTFKPPIPIMIIVYNGSEDWDGEIWFQDLYPDLTDELRQLVPQFRVIFINLRRFKYGNLPGKPETQAIIESLLRATDGTFIDHLPNVLRHVAESNLNEPLRWDLTKTISIYYTLTAKATSDQLAQGISTVFKGQEYIKMIEEIKDSYILEGIEIGEALGEVRGELKGKIQTILTFLHAKFHHVPDEVVIELNKRTDPTALDSLAVLSAQCKTLDEFTKVLK